MIALQPAADPTTLGVVLLSVVTVLVILLSFVRAFGRIRAGPDPDHDLEEPGRRSV